MSDKNGVPTKILWVDLEMTGLDPQQDVILEVAAEITDFNFTSIASFQSRVNQDRQVVVDRMEKNTWWADYPDNRDDFIQKLDAGKSSGQVEQDLIALIEANFGSEPAILAGNSIYNDRMFIKHWWPALDSKLHYRMLDVSAWKIFMQGRHGVEFEKKSIHLAFDDIQESIAELQYYLEWFNQENK